MTRTSALPAQTSAPRRADARPVGRETEFSAGQEVAQAVPRGIHMKSQCAHMSMTRYNANIHHNKNHAPPNVGTSHKYNEIYINHIITKQCDKDGRKACISMNRATYKFAPLTNDVQRHRNNRQQLNKIRKETKT